MTLKPCLDCGEPSPATRCTDCKAPDRHQLTSTARGYDYAWSKLSLRARKMQPFCSDCLTRDDLTVDHSAEAWAAKAAGRSITLAMIEVVCRPCNSRRGAIRHAGQPLTPTPVTPPSDQAKPPDKAQSPLHTLGGYR